MPNRSLKTKPKICVAVKSDDVSHRTLKIAEQYCLRTKSDMHLVTICENVFTGNSAAFASSSAAPFFADFFVTLQDGIQEVAESKMAQLAKSIQSPIKVTTSVSIAGAGTPAELIEAEALSQQCNMVMVGVSPQSHRFLPKGLSCALSLMSRSKLPVMVINQNQVAELESPRLKLLIADDLKNQSVSAVGAGFDMAFHLGNVDIHHVHINGLTKDALEAAIQSALASSHSQPSPAISANDVFNMSLKQLESKLETRTSGLGVSLELSGCTYKRSIVTDDSVTERLDRLAKQEKANIVVFGRHHSFHASLFNVGQMPFYAMLKLDCPIVVFPVDEK